MTVSFNADDSVDVCQELFNPLIKKQTAKQQSDNLYLFLSYITFSEKKPLVWEPFSTRGDKDGFSAYVDVVESLQKQKDITGFKVVCFHMNALDENYVPQRIAKYCAEKWEPKIKTYVNGPKKSFPKKASGHF